MPVTWTSPAQEAAAIRRRMPEILRVAATREWALDAREHSISAPMEGKGGFYDQLVKAIGGSWNVSLGDAPEGGEDPSLWLEFDYGSLQVKIAASEEERLARFAKDNVIRVNRSKASDHKRDLQRGLLASRKKLAAWGRK